MQQNKIESCFIAGPCARKANLWQFGKLTSSDYKQYITGVAQIITNNFKNIEIIPDDGVPLDIAKKIRQFDYRPNIIGYFPKNGLSSHLEKNYKYCDKIVGINGGWTTLNTLPSSFSGLFLCFGLSPGVFQEISHTKIHKIWNGVDVKILLDERAISGHLPPELETEINLTYFESDEQLDTILNNFAVAQYNKQQSCR